MPRGSGHPQALAGHAEGLAATSSPAGREPLGRDSHEVERGGPSPGCLKLLSLPLPPPFSLPYSLAIPIPLPLSLPTRQGALEGGTWAGGVTNTAGA